MAIPTFVQKSRINQVIYQIRADRLLISERRFVGRFQDRELNLHWVDPNYIPGIARSYTPLIISLLLALLCGLAVWGALRQSVIPREAVVQIIQLPAIGFALFLAAAVQWSRRIEYYRFNNLSGQPVLAIIRERAQAEECAAFINILVAHIEMTQRALPLEPDAPQVATSSVRYAPIGGPGKGVVLWKVSIVLGALASGLPWIPNFDVALDGMLFPLVYVCCTSGATLGAFSLSKKEPGRWWGLLGLTLCLVPPLFYS
jgi:hypothetical protein